jgi:hypothetical protein
MSNIALVTATDVKRKLTEYIGLATLNMCNGTEVVVILETLETLS